MALGEGTEPFNRNSLFGDAAALVNFGADVIDGVFHPIETLEGFAGAAWDHATGKISGKLDDMADPSGHIFW